MTKPILFNTAMVRAILDGRKTVTRRVVKPNYRDNEIGFNVITNAHTGEYVCIEYLDEWDDVTRHMPEPYRPGDILYVRETWRVQSARRFDADARIEFKAGGDMVRIQFPGGGDQYHSRREYDAFVARWADNRWRPSIHMPREAARIFLRVTDVRVERLQEITDEDLARDFCFCPEAIKAVGRDALAGSFWNSTIKPADRALYGWEANPWCWVIEFERCEKPKKVAATLGIDKQ